MRSLFASAAVLFLAAPALAAQEKPAPAVTAALAGTWRFDASRSDSMPGSPGALFGGGEQRPGGAAGAAAAVGGAPTGGGGGGRRRGGGGGGGGGGGESGGGGGLGARGGGGGRMNDPKMRSLMAEARPAPEMVITASDFDATIADDAGHITTWRADGRKKQEAQMEGGVIEFEAKWKGKALVLSRNIPESATLRREFKPSDDGKSLEVKSVLEMGGRKVERKFVYTRVETAP
ncbi:MAG: hypothetical protein V4503_08425 [Gemmatimonadota bacterium]